MDVFAYIWLGVMILFGIMEAATAALVSLWFVGGSLAALCAALLGAEFWLQVTVFVVVSAILLACLRPFVKKLSPSQTHKTNFDRIIGVNAPVTEAIDNLMGTGAVKVDGTEWSARSLDGQPIEVGTVVTIREIRGVKVMVSPAEP